MQNNDEKMLVVLSSIEEMLRSQNSFKKIFLNGLLRGLGTAIGATVLFAVLTSSLFYFTESIDVRAFVESFVGASI